MAISLRAFDPIEAIAELIRIPSVSTDTRRKEDMRRARTYLGELFARLGLETDVVETPLHPILLGRRPGPEQWPHVVIYGHYDVQPEDPVDLWETPPFEPTIIDGRIYGRGAADNKGPFMVHLTALAAALEADAQLPLRVTILVEGEEEIGSPSFPVFLARHSGELRGDFAMLSDTLSPSAERIAITTGLRGIVATGIRVTGPNRDLHSGLHGGAVMNPIRALMQVCASFHDSDGRVNLPGFYDGIAPVQDWEREEIARLGSGEADYARFLGVTALAPQRGLSCAEAVRLAPTLEFNGIGGGYQGEGSKTIIPSSAFAKVSCRLVAGQDPQMVQESLFRAVRERIPPGVQVEFEPEHVGDPYQVVPPGRPNTPLDQNRHLAHAFGAADAAIRDTFGEAPLYLREGGSVPIIASLKEQVGLDSLMIGMFTPEDNLHAPNEGFDLNLFEKGVCVARRILEQVAAEG